MESLRDSRMESYTLSIGRSPKTNLPRTSTVAAHGASTVASMVIVLGAVADGFRSRSAMNSSWAKRSSAVNRPRSSHSMRIHTVT